MAAPRSGNLERGWNDPPVFDYQSSSALQSSPRKTVLNKRVAYPSMTGPTNVDNNLPKGALLNPTEGPPKNEVLLLPPSSDISTPTPVPLLIPSMVAPVKPLKTEDTSKEELKISRSLEEVLQRLQLSSDADLSQCVQDTLIDRLQKCKDILSARAAEDVKRKIQYLQSAWKEGKLSLPVRCRMGNIVEALKNEKYMEAWDIHQTLMVDYTAEVHLWLVGVKRIIHELKQIKVNQTDNSVEEKNSTETSECVISNCDGNEAQKDLGRENENEALNGSGSEQIIKAQNESDAENDKSVQKDGKDTEESVSTSKSESTTEKGETEL